ncbi:hypothetical protein V7112_08845 [Bacillus sp. JJ1566]|uniref:hypothetical protein n=1 Tax=Bacillus sp. JJ1566 TaxID=3122961 RepID=UPI0030008DCF
MNRNSNNSVFLQQKIIHLQSELSKFKSHKKEKLLFENQALREQVNEIGTENQTLREQVNEIGTENQTLREQINQLRSESEKLKNQLASKSAIESTEMEQPESPKENQTSREIEGWFLSNLIYESNKK